MVGDADEETIEEEEDDEVAMEGEGERKVKAEGSDILYHACLPILDLLRYQVNCSLPLYNLNLKSDLKRNLVKGNSWNIKSNSWRLMAWILVYNLRFAVRPNASST